MDGFRKGSLTVQRTAKRIGMSRKTSIMIAQSKRKAHEIEQIAHMGIYHIRPATALACLRLSQWMLRLESRNEIRLVGQRRIDSGEQGRALISLRHAKVILQRELRLCVGARDCRFKTTAGGLHRQNLPCVGLVHVPIVSFIFRHRDNSRLSS